MSLSPGPGRPRPVASCVKVAEAALSRAIPLVVDDSELKGNAKSSSWALPPFPFEVPIEQEDLVTKIFPTSSPVVL